MTEFFPGQAPLFEDNRTDPALPPEATSGTVLEIRKIPGLPTGFFNAAAWKEDDSPDSRTLLLGRYVENRSPAGEPDVGTLVLAALRGGAVESFTQVWEPETDNRGDLLEDTRVIQLPDGRLITGYTRLMPVKDGKYVPFPGVSVTTTTELLSGRFPSTYPITGLGSGDETVPIGGGPNMYHLLAGKNATPFGSGQFMFRPESESHRLLVCSLDIKGAAQNVQYLDFPKDEIPNWARFKIGSTMPPVWLNDREAVFIIHGIQMVEGRYRYSIGSARLLKGGDGQYAVDNISQEPLLTPELFRGLFPEEDVELRLEERQAVYLCGGIVRRGANGAPQFINAYPNVGDTRTVEAVLSVDEIVKKWGETQPASF